MESKEFESLKTSAKDYEVPADFVRMLLEDPNLITAIRAGQVHSSDSLERYIDSQGKRFDKISSELRGISFKYLALLNALFCSQTIGFRAIY